MINRLHPQVNHQQPGARRRNGSELVRRATDKTLRPRDWRSPTDIYHSLSQKGRSIDFIFYFILNFLAFLIS
jgi:hypothetical protein